MSSSSSQPRQRLIVAITGATGAIYGVRLLEHLRKHGQVETHLMVSEAGVLNLHQELDMRRKDVEALADVVHNVRDVGACIASGSFASTGMVVAPCSMKTLAAVAHGLSDNLITRAADVVLKERRRLVLMVRETPFNLAHLRNMTSVTEMGGVIFPPLPGFYQRPASMEEMVDHTLGRVLDMFGISMQLTPEWKGMKGGTE
ncbi:MULTISPECIES: UbiX family flavin prenyltransferase [Herbaspirillum]|mgnify:FL=1|jgi:4-hydroxy-3-polyprenylbenzoate decarboxylase|uniref:Flavin prenyltransferase UbiX n=2 Tax=Herbaspirillum TaxID=963 RepID=A0A225SVG3_9BURK|nr:MULTISPECIES: UbiX family flavin prenyltransferase [Herbaspirillum]MDR6742710.1 4-hydroxy-3-polyprenylbenzoate decarboxylase [Herbaspirillum sp. 1173]MDR9850086.1 UbiX family flavin prenyltransferase [Herbaspirillum huttiense SE1]MDT0358882.1 UbiX family flavin prenyltransferase [Herbaspirillum huttiense F1]OWY33508.1 3-octaprenyl-4-hydroxybenzoate carboxy-lyase [Herbaspirillum aquaticum]QBP77254.1 UbiX family flavin prenyltransferase [Herbaspirillum huttiense]